MKRNLDTQSAKSSSDSIGPKQIDSDGRFSAWDDGTVFDSETGLCWAAADNGRDIDWNGAKEYCESYDGGGYDDWRMPTQDELFTLYDAGEAGYYTECSKNCKVYLTRLIRISGYWVWAAETNDSMAVYIYFSFGTRFSLPQTFSDCHRALPVRQGGQSVPSL